VYAYWPWDKPYPKFRKQGLIQKKAMLISSSAAPSWMGRWLFGTGRQLDVAAKTIGAKSVGTLFTGQASSEKHQRLTQQSVDRARVLASRLIAV
ncbi:MAG: NAD(P)H-dependent oxidoreductase, partial [Gammaproteobacteria bacterium]|nr:NAD(P)H-dependent oxidoreductase [Gammaproteobacteria bacterium]